MGFQHDLVPALKDWGLADYLVLVNGHQTRGSEAFNPGGSVNHHTAGSIYNSIPSLRLLIEGDASRGIPGPLCNVAQSRSSNFDPKAKFDQVYVVAIGRANHAGHGGWAGLVGNSSVFGLEIEHCGYLDREPFSERRAHTAHRIHCAFADAGGFDASKVCQHKEWAPTRKIDFVGEQGGTFRQAVILNQIAKTQPQEPADVPIFASDPERNHFVVTSYQRIAERTPSASEAAAWVWKIGAESERFTFELMTNLEVEARALAQGRLNKAITRLSSAEGRITTVEGKVADLSSLDLTEAEKAQIIGEVYADLTKRITTA